MADSIEWHMFPHEMEIEVTELSDVIDLSADEIDAVAGGLLGGVIKSPVDLSMVSGGPAGWLPGSIPGATYDGGRWGWAAETGSSLAMSHQIGVCLMFDILRQ